jgi:GNAT superfamily N-acetyltransferase
MSQANHIIVRPAGFKDVESIVTFSAALAQETEGRQLDQDRLRAGTLALLESADHGFFLVAELPQAGQPFIVGQLMITYEWSDWRNGVFWWIQSVYVTPVWRRQGVFRRMHEAVVMQAKTDPKVCGLRLYVEHHNQTARSVYERVGLAPSPYTVYEKDFVLSRQLLPQENK